MEALLLQSEVQLAAAAPAEALAAALAARHRATALSADVTAAEATVAASAAWLALGELQPPAGLTAAVSFVTPGFALV